jgi:hypothetical protein
MSIARVRHLIGITLFVLLLSPIAVMGGSDLHTALFTPRASLPVEIVQEIQVGDIVFTREPYMLLREVARAGGSWMNHVGIVVDTSGADPIVAESKVPRARLTPLSRFVHRSAAGYVAVLRLKESLDATQQAAMVSAARTRVGRWYDLGFDLYSSRQFCSKLVFESLLEATGKPVAEPSTFAQLLQNNPAVPLGFWKIWYFGEIPWQRVTLTPAALYHSPNLRAVYDSTTPPEVPRPAAPQTAQASAISLNSEARPAAIP